MGDDEVGDVVVFSLYCFGLLYVALGLIITVEYWRRL